MRLRWLRLKDVACRRQASPHGGRKAEAVVAFSGRIPLWPRSIFAGIPRQTPSPLGSHFDMLHATEQKNELLNANAGMLPRCKATSASVPS